MKRLGLSGVFALICWLTAGSPQILERPKWMDDPGIVMAGSWESPAYRARSMDRLDFKLPPDKLADYAREHSAALIAELKQLGLNFVMIHCYKGAGYETEREGMEDAKRFAELAHKSGLRVGTYIGGTMLFETLFKEEPNAPQWQAFGPDGEFLFYSPKHTYRFAAVRNHPGFIKHLQRAVRYAIEEIHTDLVHFDNFGVGGASYDPVSRQQFHEFLKARGKAEADPPTKTDNLDDPLVSAWLRFRCQALTDHYATMSSFIRLLNPRCAVECNPGGVAVAGGATRGIDHASLLPHGNAFWDENYGADWSKDKGITRSRIRSMKVGRLYCNSTFLYCESPLDIAESMAFNENCIGSVTWFEWGKVTAAHLTGKPVAPELKPYVRFFLDHQDLFRKSQPVSDVAVLRTFSAQNFGTNEERTRRYNIEQSLIQGHAAWRIVYDQQVNALGEYRAVVAPESKWLTPQQQRELSAYAAKGGKVVTDTAIEKPENFPASVRDRMRIAIEAPPSVAIELCQQDRPERVLIHFVNFDADNTIRDIPVKLRLRKGKSTSARLLSPDPAGERSLAIDMKGGVASFRVPQLRIYALIVVDRATL